MTLILISSCSKPSVIRSCFEFCDNMPQFKKFHVKPIYDKRNHNNWHKEMWQLMIESNALKKCGCVKDLDQQNECYKQFKK